MGRFHPCSEFSEFSSLSRVDLEKSFHLVRTPLSMGVFKGPGTSALWESSCPVCFQPKNALWTLNFSFHFISKQSSIGFLSPVSNDSAVAPTPLGTPGVQSLRDPRIWTGSGAWDTILKVTQESVGRAGSYAQALDPWVCGPFARPHRNSLARERKKLPVLRSCRAEGSSQDTRELSMALSCCNSLVKLEESRTSSYGPVWKTLTVATRGF